MYPDSYISETWSLREARRGREKDETFHFLCKEYPNDFRWNCNIIFKWQICVGWNMRIYLLVRRPLLSIVDDYLTRHDILYRYNSLWYRDDSQKGIHEEIQDYYSTRSKTWNILRTITTFKPVKLLKLNRK